MGARRPGPAGQPPDPDECDHEPVLGGGGPRGDGTVVALWQCPTCGHAVVSEHTGASDGDVLFPGWNAPETKSPVDQLKGFFK